MLKKLKHRWTELWHGDRLDRDAQDELAHHLELAVAEKVGIAGSSRIGRGAILLGQVGVGDHVTVGERAVLAAQAGTAQDVGPGEKLFGTWARPIVQARRIWIAEAELPELVRRVRALEHRLAELEGRIGKEDERR